MSMELIDSKKLSDYFFYGIDDKSITGSTETDEKVIQVIQSQETVKAIPLDKLEQIRAEIEQEYNKFRNMSDEWSERACGLGTALEIIDKVLKEHN